MTAADSFADLAKALDGPPYVQMWGQAPDGQAVWLVDGDYVRDHIDPDFTDYGEHQHDPYVPENELWIDAETEAGEVETMMMSAYRELTQSGSDHSYDLLHDKVDAESRAERRDLDTDNQADMITVELPRLGPFRVFIVDGEKVRDRFDPDFIYGGHDLVYPFIPPRTIWIEDTISDLERPPIMLHELTERVDMQTGMPYKPAHRDATDKEMQARRDPDQVGALIAAQVARATAMLGSTQEDDTMSTIEKRVIELLKGAGLYDDLARLIAKEEPAAGDVHVSNASIEGRRRSAQTFAQLGIAADPKKPDQDGDGDVSVTDLTTKLYPNGVHSDAKTFDQVDKAEPRRLRPIDQNNSHSPFSHDPQALEKLRADQVPRFLGAITDQDKLETRTVRLNGLHAMQNRVDSKKVESMRQSRASSPGASGDQGGASKPALVVRFAGKNYIADGHHRLAASWLDGENTADVHYANITGKDEAVKPDQEDDHSLEEIGKAVCPVCKGRDQDCEKCNGTGFVAKAGDDDDEDEDEDAPEIEPGTEMLPDCRACGGTGRAGGVAHQGPHCTACGGSGVRKSDDDGEWSIDFKIAKVDTDQQMVFGWASIAEKDGKLVVDKQQDMIEPAELEKAAYDFVLYSREQDDMHTHEVQGRMIESMVFTQLKQELLGVQLRDPADGKAINTAWWTGWKVESPELWKLYKSGKRPEFSIGGHSRREEV